MNCNDVPPNWKIEPVSALANPNKYSCVGGPFGSSLTRKDYVDYEGVPVSRGSNLIIGSRLFLDDDFVYVSTEKAKKLEKNTAYPGDIILTQRGTIGQVAIIPKNSRYDRYILSQNQMKITVDETKVHPYYFLYYFLSQEVQNTIQRLSIGGVIPGFNLTQFRKFEVVVPPIEEQNRIVDILSSIDDKIELNRQINQALEQIAQVIFISWFVDFEPVKAKIEAKQNGQDPERAAMHAISGKTDEQLAQLSKEQRQQLTTVTALFPIEMEETEYGENPKGWSAAKYNDVYEEQKEKVKARDDVHVLSAVQSGELKLPGDVFDKQVHSKDISKYKIVNVGDLAYNPSRINIGSAGFNEFEFVGAVSPVYTVMGLKDQYFGPFARMHLKLGLTKEWINILCSGSVRQSLSANDFLSIPVVLPGNDLFTEFSKIYKSFETKINANKVENRVLESIRDSLLPKLLSGEIVLGDTQSTAEAVA